MALRASTLLYIHSKILFTNYLCNTFKLAFLKLLLISSTSLFQTQDSTTVIKCHNLQKQLQTIRPRIQYRSQTFCSCALYRLPTTHKYGVHIATSMSAIGSAQREKFIFILFSRGFNSTVPKYPRTYRRILGQNISCLNKLHSAILPFSCCLYFLFCLRLVCNFLQV